MTRSSDRGGRRRRREHPDPRRSLQELEGEDWGDPASAPTTLISTVLAARRKPLEALTVEDLRIAIGQRVSLSILVPRAVAVLEGDPLAEGTMAPGVLLRSVLRAPDDFWERYEHLLEHVDAIAERALQAESSDDDRRVEPRVADEELRALVAAFRRAHPSRA